MEILNWIVGLIILIPLAVNSLICLWLWFDGYCWEVKGIRKVAIFVIFLSLAVLLSVIIGSIKFTNIKNGGTINLEFNLIRSIMVFCLIAMGGSGYLRSNPIELAVLLCCFTTFTKYL
ncbi:hypothetical protein NE686_17220 [Tissierella carlieri]|uniref:Uncharacterized protein n=1 Tax=Tissierella carlieri TaxID=689904 RepID=A0ABT1SED7_9FIRM|nr:hypothetical protein [Tissierella carlieri]MCQ4924846.1 hypothetical protein [Tissierella carlieri]